jgi:hypothetical protein
MARQEELDRLFGQLNTNLPDLVDAGSGVILPSDQQDTEVTNGPVSEETPPTDIVELPGAVGPDYFPPPTSDDDDGKDNAEGATAGTNPPKPVSEDGPAAYTANQPNDAPAESVRFSRKLPRISGSLDPTDMYAEGPEGQGAQSALIQAILDALGELFYGTTPY